MSESDRPRKLIEVALPLDEINAACKADKDRKTGTIRNIHKWFAPMPLPAWRALLYAALIDDPDDDEKRANHLDLIKRLVKNGADLPDPDDVAEAQRNLKKQFPDGVPTVMDPFCGGGSTLVEAQRLGLPTFGSDLNPVPVLITRTLTDLLPKVYGQQPLHPERAATSAPPSARGNKARPTKSRGMPLDLAIDETAKQYEGYAGLSRDVTHYAQQIGEQAWESLRDLYPSQPAILPIAWLWARTVKCPNPACGIETVLATSWWLSKKKGELAWIEPAVKGGRVVLEVISKRSSGEAPAPPKSGRGTFECIGCQATIDETHLQAEGSAGRLGLRMTAAVEEVDGKRTYRAVDERDVPNLAEDSHSFASIPLSHDTRSMWCVLYGVDTWNKLYTARQLKTLITFADLVSRVQQQVIADGGSSEWADAIATLLGLAIGRLAHVNSQQTRWNTRNAAYQSKAEPGFARNDLPMTWDFAEPFIRSGSVGDWMGVIQSQARSFALVSKGNGTAVRADARTSERSASLVATDPPYFDAIGYADLSDFFYIWHRRALKSVHPDLYSTVAAPKEGELTAIPSHHGNDKEAARTYFIEGFTETFNNLKRSMGDGIPMIVVYASKEQKSGAGEETRWAAILTAMIQADLEITGTWPIHGTGASRMIGIGTNAVATYVAMICRPRPSAAGICTLADFNRALRRELKPAVADLQAAGILPVDMAQAAMGPGMQVYSRYREVVDQSGSRVPVDQALRLINQALTEVLDEQEGELDPASRFAVSLWEKHHWQEAVFGVADQLSRPQGISVDDVVRSGVLTYPRPGFVKLLGEDELDRNWAPGADARPTAWEAVHHLSERLINGGGAEDAGALMAELGELRDPAQALVYRLHAIAARQGWTADQERYNSLIASWSDLLAEAGRVHESGDGLF